MPRLMGKKSNGGLYASLLLLVAIGTVGLLEYSGVTDFVPQFGATNRYSSEAQLPAEG